MFRKATRGSTKNLSGKIQKMTELCHHKVSLPNLVPTLYVETGFLCDSHKNIFSHILQLLAKTTYFTIFQTILHIFVIFPNDFKYF